MKKMTKGALAMVLAGSVTFSAVAALLTGPSSEQLAEESTLTLSEDQTTAGVINQAEKAGNNQTPAANVKDVQAKPSDHSSAFLAEAPQNKEQLTAAVSIQSVPTDTTTTTTPAAATISGTSTKAPPTTTTTTVPAIPASTETDTANETTTTIPPAAAANTTTSESTTTTAATNRGQQKASQVLKEEKAASRQDKKETNGKKM